MHILTISITLNLLILSSTLKSFKLDKVKYKFEVLGTSIAEISKFYYLKNQTHLTLIKSVKPKNYYKIIDVMDTLVRSFNMPNQKIFTTFQIEYPNSIGCLNATRRSSNIFFIDSIESLKEISTVLNSINFRIRKIFTVVSIEELNVEEMKEIFEIFMKKLLINANIVTFGPNKTLNMFTFFPFRNSTDCNNLEPVKISTFNETNEKWSSTNLHNRKVNDLKGCPLLIGSAVASAQPGLMHRNKSNNVVEIYGIEKDIFDELAKALNFTAVYKPYFNGIGTIAPNGTGFGVLGEVHKNKLDVGIGFVSLQYVRTMFLSETSFYTMAPLMLVVPPGEEYDAFEKLLLPFDNTTWMVFFLVLIIAVIFPLICYKYPKLYDFVVGTNIKYPVTTMLAVYLGVSQPQLPKRNFSRFILMNFLIYCLIFRSAYQGSFFNNLVSNKHKPAVSSVNEMVQKKFKFYMYETLAGRLQDFATLQKHRFVFPNTQIEKYRRMTLDPSFKGAVFSYLPQVLYLNQLNRNNFTYTLCKESFITPSFVFYFRMDHYLVPNVNSVLDKMQSNGIIDFISSQYADKRFLKSKPDGGRKVLEINRLYGAIGIYFLCTFISFLIFIMELATKFKRLLCRKKIK